MDLIARVERRAREVVAGKRLPRRDDGDQHGQRSAARENAAASLAISDDLAEPSDHVRLELREHRRSGEDADITIDRVGDQIGDRGVEDSATGNEREIARPGGVVRSRDRFIEQKVEKLVVRLAALRQRLQFFAKHTIGDNHHWATQAQRLDQL